MHLHVYACGRMYVVSVDEVLTLKAVTKHLFTSMGVGCNLRDHLEESGQTAYLLEEIIILRLIDYNYKPTIFLDIFF